MRMCKGGRGIITSALIYTPNNIASIVQKILIFSLILLKMYVGLRF